MRSVAALPCAAALVIVACFCAANALSIPRTLLIADTSSIQESHSLFIQNLRATGREVDIRDASDTGLRLRDWDIWLYSELVIFAPQADGFGGAVDNGAITEFLDAGNSVLVAVDSLVTDEQRQLIADFGVDLEQTGTAVIDHFNHVVGDPDHAAITADVTLQARGVWGGEVLPKPVIFRGIGMSISPDSKLGVMALSASSTAYSATRNKILAEVPTLIGSVGLAALMQTRNQARIAVVGSVDLFSDAFYKASVMVQGKPTLSGNEIFGTSITQWVFQERGVLKASNLQHRHADEPEGSPPPEIYRVNDRLIFSIDIEELSDKGWHAFRADDVQVEMVMLHPYVRQALKHNDQGTFSTEIVVPDVYGVFKFVVSYKRDGYTSIEMSQEVPVRPFKHNEFERFLTAAYPYYASATSTMLAFFVFSFVYLYQK